MSRRRIPWVLCLLMPAACAWAGANDWFPVPTISAGKAYDYMPLAQAAHPWRICALLPHGKDRYWWGVSWGLAGEAKRQGVKLGIYQAGGYEYLARQRQQFAHCMARRADAIVLAAISADGLNPDIAAAAAAGIPVIDLVNGVSSTQVAARSLVSFAEMAAVASRYIIDHAGGKPITLAWFPGPADAGWVRDGEAGLHRSLPGLAVTVLPGGNGPPDASSQMTLVRELMARHAPDYVLGNALAAEAAANYLHANRGGKTNVLSYYATEPVIELIKAGRILAAPSDSSIVQARIAIDLAVRILEKQPYLKQVGPRIEMLDRERLRGYPMERLLPPKGQWFIQQDLLD